MRSPINTLAWTGRGQLPLSALRDQQAFVQLPEGAARNLGRRNSIARRRSGQQRSKYRCLRFSIPEIAETSLGLRESSDVVPPKSCERRRRMRVRRLHVSPKKKHL